MLRDNAAIKEAVLFSTCNRVELLMAVDERRRGIVAAKRFLAEFKKVPLSRFEDCSLQYVQGRRCRPAHLPGGVQPGFHGGGRTPDSRPDEEAPTGRPPCEKTSGVILNKLLHRTFFVAKKVRTETGIGDHAVSISYAAIELGKKIFGDLEGKRSC
jgi:glutamyl-tRNA reductase